jgi:DNA-binding beta-propeller fold protein YncE
MKHASLAAILGVFLLGPSSQADQPDVRQWKLTMQSDALFARPHDLVLGPDRRFLYVTDMNNDAIAVLDPDTLTLIDRFGQGALKAPHDIVFDREGRLLVADSGNDRIAIFAVEGSTGRLVGEMRAELASPEGIAVLDGTVYTTAVGSGEVVRIRADGAVSRIGGIGSVPGRFVRPHDLEIGPEKRLYVADPGNDRIQILDLDLQLVEILHGPDYAFNEPKYLATDKTGRLYVADQHNDVIKVFGPERELLEQIGRAGGNAAQPALSRPEGVEVVDGTLWIADTYNDRILRLTRIAAP